MWNKMKQTLKRILFIVSSLIIVALGCSCKGNGNENVNGGFDESSIVLNQPILTMNVGDTYQLELINATTNVVWESLKTGVAEISANGEVTAISPGEAQIKATANGITRTCYVIVQINLVSVPVFELKGMDKENGRYERNLMKGDSYDFTPTLVMGTETLEVEVSIASSNPDALAVVGNKVYALLETSDAYLTFSCVYNEKEYTVICYVTVEEVI